MQIAVPNKELIDPSCLTRTEVFGISKDLDSTGKPFNVFFFILPNTEILSLDTYEVDDKFISIIRGVQFRYIHPGAIKIGTWHNPSTTNYLQDMKFTIPDNIKSNLDLIESLFIETIDVAADKTETLESTPISLKYAAALDFVEVSNNRYNKCAKIQYRIVYKNNTTEIFKFNPKSQAIYNTNAQLVIQQCVRHKTSKLFEDTKQGREECLSILDEKIIKAFATKDTETGNKNLIYYTIYFNKGYIELLNQSIMSILKHSKINFDLLLITDFDTQKLILQQPFVQNITPKFLITETPFDGVEASQSKTKIFNFPSNK